MVVARAKCQAPSTPRPDSGCCRASCCTWGSDSNQVGSWHLGLSCRLPAHIRYRFGTTRTARRGECSWRRCRCLNHTTRSHNSRLRDSCRRPHTRIGSHCPRDRPPFCRKTRRVRHLRLRGSKCCRPSFGRKELAVEDGRLRRARGTACGPTGAASSASRCLPSRRSATRAQERAAGRFAYSRWELRRSQLETARAPVPVRVNWQPH